MERIPLAQASPFLSIKLLSPSYAHVGMNHDSGQKACQGRRKTLREECSIHQQNCYTSAVQCCRF